MDRGRDGWMDKIVKMMTFNKQGFKNFTHSCVVDCLDCNWLEVVNYFSVTAALVLSE